MEHFEGLATPPTFLSTDVNTLMGFHVDGEAIFDANTGSILQSYISAENIPEKNFL
jgi:hypothetical protein